jgi:hypothetical protein
MYTGANKLFDYVSEKEYKSLLIAISSIDKAIIFHRKELKEQTNKAGV